jgi:hypothetical protein
MPTGDVVLQGTEVRLEPLAPRHIDGLALAATVDPTLYVGAQSHKALPLQLSMSILR